jgi:plastocyanin
VSNSEKGLPEKSVNRFKKIKDYGLPLGIIALSLVIVYILWATFGYIGPSFSNDVLSNQQEMLRERYKLPSVEEESTAASEVPPSLREAMESNKTETSNLQNTSELNDSAEMATQQSTTNTTTTTTTTSGTSDNATTSGSIQQGQQQQQPQTTGGTADVTLTILEGSATQGNPDYEPDELTITKGNTILVDNVDTMPHTVTNGESTTDPNSAKLFDTSIIMGGESAEIDTSNIDPGTHPYYCMVHPYMTGSLTIQ